VKVQLTTLNAKLRAKEQQPDPLQQEAGLKAQLKTVVDKLVKLVSASGGDYHACMPRLFLACLFLRASVAATERGASFLPVIHNSRD
jgi:hypothetical protein